jgi:hypothetical protein
MKFTFIRTTVVPLLVLFLSTVAVAQAPQRMSYQAVIRNTEGTLLTSSAIGVKVSLLQGSEAGTAVYEETFSGTTNENGLLTLELGGGTPVSGSFAAINWSTGIYYVKTETDPTGGTNYSITAVGQLLSVPYAFYASNSSVQGKTTIILTGDVTDAEAAAQLTRELGYNTENIIIDGTTQLTTVDFSGVTNLVSLSVSFNDVLTSINFSHLAKVFRNIEIVGNPSLAAVSFPELVNCNGTGVTISENSVLTSIDFPVLVNLKKASLVIQANVALTQINFNMLAKSDSVNIYNNSALATLNLPQLTETVNLVIGNNSSLATLNMSAIAKVNSFDLYNFALPSINFPQLQITTGINIAVGSLLTSIDLPLVTNCSFDSSSCPLLTSLNMPGFVTGSFALSGSGLTSIALPNLTDCRNLYFIGNAQLTSVNFSNVQTFSGTIMIINNPALTTVVFPAVIDMGEGYYHLEVQCQNNALTSETVNDILHKLLTFTFVSGNYYQMDQQNPPAPPTGQGIIDKQTLIANGNSVFTD